MDDRVAERIAQNNATFREANERIREKADQYEAGMERLPFLCECPEPTCVEIVRLTRPEYAAVRAEPGHFMTAVGHEQREQPVGEVVARPTGYVVVEK
jgi:hypothetical protein